ncbi:hypothetical protein [Streptomyces sp. TLI_185]|uniref:hypothetical protein n=1 Tax=Streptomyces sp. TLI_185 TaxID=2485151 RepID=UPI00160EE51F|nr:hypothetical protein [Streptomyces sp. TLI_185]
MQWSVARWEARRRRVLPGERYQLVLVHVYARDPDGQHSLGLGSDLAELLDVLAHLG